MSILLGWRKKLTLRNGVTWLMLLTSACTLLSAVLAIFLVFFSFFFQKAKSDIEYVLENTSQKFQSHIQFIADGAISVRHNSLLDDFFQSSQYEQDIAKKQLSYSLELFAERNQVNKQIPFVTSFYLFNKQNQAIYEHYYATTLAYDLEQANLYKAMQLNFKATNKQYDYVLAKEALNLIFRIYDDEMQEKGIAIARLNLSAIEAVFNDIKQYKEANYLILSKKGGTLLSSNLKLPTAEFLKIEKGWSDKTNVSSYNLITYANSLDFDLRSIVTVERSNIFAILWPTFSIYFLVLGLALILTFMLAYAVSYKFTKPITQMIESIQAFGKHELNARIADSQIQEFSNIATVFNEMADRIEYLITEVYEKQLLASQSQVKYLQSQINPHFQFNVLAMLSLKAKLAANENLYQSLNAFSKLMQGKIFREREIKIKVSEELEIVKFYLLLQKERYQDKLDYEINVATSEIADYLLPRLLIEPLVENAVSHGIEPKKAAGKVKVSLYIEVLSGTNVLHICVEDDGVGMSAHLPNNSTEQAYKLEHTHTSFENTQRLLNILYGERAKFSIWSARGQGTKVEIIIPVERC